MQDHRQSLVMATKYTNSAPGTDPNAAGNHRKSMAQAVEASLARPRTDYSDVYRVLYVGISDAPAWWIARANTLAYPRGWSPFIGLQIEYSLIERTVERELIPMAKALNLGLSAWSRLANGVPTGKYHGHGSSEPRRMSTGMMKEFVPEPQPTGRIVAAASPRPSRLYPMRSAAAWRRSRRRGFGTTPCRSSPSSARESFLSCRTIWRAST